MTVTAEELQEKLNKERKRRGARVGVQEPMGRDGLVPVASEGVGICTDCGSEFDYQAFMTRGGLLVRGERCSPCYTKWRTTTEEPPEVRTDPTVHTPATRIEKVLGAMDAIGINVRRHGHLRLDDLDPHVAAAGSEFVRSALASGKWREVNGLYVYGPTGTGKSQLVVSVVRALLEAGWHERGIIYDRGRAMITQLQDCYGKSTVDAFSERRRRARLWVYEDVGTEKLTPDAFRVLEDIIDRREGHPTLMTSNLSRRKMAERWRDVSPGWERLLSRLAPFQVVQVKGKDKRLQA